MKTYPIIIYRSKSKALMFLNRKIALITHINNSRKGLLYIIILLFAFLLGLSPVVLNFVIDPYNINKTFDLKLNKEKISLKAHYPLWKIANFPKETATTIILGDSRALALKDKYWHQLEFYQAYNFAYGGATISEIHDTFAYIKNNSEQLKTLVIGIQLRSFSPLFKKGLNRVPEAIKLANNPLQYYSNSFITKVSWQQVKSHYNKRKLFSNYLPMSSFNFISQANASQVLANEESLATLLDPKYCLLCILPKNIKPQPLPYIKKINISPIADLGVWQSLWPQVNYSRLLPDSFNNQVIKNAKSDWLHFSFSQQYWSKLVEISQWCRQNKVKLLFLIPPTITEMQQQITNFGFSKDNHQLRENLAKLAPVIDFDFNNEVTNNLSNFNDAYHFNFKLAKAIIGELVQLINESPISTSLAHKRRTIINCPINENDITMKKSDAMTTVTQGKACRIWRGHYE
ncbi:MAG: DUF1574 family protein [Colwellia sp.]|nr:DUF1574 family protein [Colwellia sp.]